MKNLLFLLWIFPAVCVAQRDSSAIKPHEIYCKLQLEGGGFIKYRVKADFGKKSGSLFSLEKEFNRLNENLALLDNEIDGVNYLVSQGWEVVAFTERYPFFTYLLKKKY